MADANIAFLEKGPWYLLNDVDSMRALVEYVKTIVGSLDVQNVGIHGNCIDNTSFLPFETKRALLHQKLEELPNNKWQLQFITFCSFFLIDTLVEK